jgi:hypothetical protein
MSVSKQQVIDIFLDAIQKIREVKEVKSDQIDQNEVNLEDSFLDDSKKRPLESEDSDKYYDFWLSVKKHGFKWASEHNEWYKTRYGRPLEGIIANLGTDGRNNEAKRIFGLILSGREGHLEAKPQGGPGKKICILCNHKKNCPSSLYLEDEDNRTYSYSIGSKCAKIAYSALEFVKAIEENKEFTEVDQIFEDLMDAHAGKKNSDE